MEIAAQCWVSMSWKGKNLPSKMFRTEWNIPAPSNWSGHDGISRFWWVQSFVIHLFRFVPANLTELNIPLYSLIFIYGKNVNKKENSRTHSSRYQRGKDNLFSWPYPIFFYDYSSESTCMCYMHLLTSGYYRGQCMHLQPYNLENKNRHYLK